MLLYKSPLVNHSIIFCMCLVNTHAKGGCPGYPGAHNFANQSLDRIPFSWVANPHISVMNPLFKHPSKLIRLNKGKYREGWSGGMLENNCDKMLINNHHQTTRELTDVN